MRFNLMYPVLYYYLFYKFFSTFIIAGIYGVPVGEYENSPCDNGICKLALDCPESRKAIKEHTLHNLERCGFKGFDEIVCCPQSRNTSSLPSTSSSTEGGNVWTDRPTHEVRGPNSVRRCVQACDKFSSEVKISLSFHIVDGENAEAGEFPHMAALGYKSIENPGQIDFKCGGTLISYRYVITAAHCIINSDQNAPILVRLGQVDVPPSISRLTKDDYNVTNITLHSDYKWKEKLNDIALLKLQKKVVPSDKVHPACLYTQSDDPLGLVVTGWGSTSLGGERSNILQKAKLTPVPLKECNTTFVTRTNRHIASTQMCAADNTSDACQGDSGGPLQIQNANGSSVYTLVGVTSYGIGCASKYPGIYTRVASYLDWIERFVWPD